MAADIFTQTERIAITEHDFRENISPRHFQSSDTEEESEIYGDRN